MEPDQAIATADTRRNGRRSTASSSSHPTARRWTNARMSVVDNRTVADAEMYVNSPQPPRRPTAQKLQGSTGQWRLRRLQSSAARHQRPSLPDDRERGGEDGTSKTTRGRAGGSFTPTQWKPAMNQVFERHHILPAREECASQP